ncbi:MAG: hypothetical protein WCG35_00350 [Betaproteobacteria bacterium]
MIRFSPLTFLLFYPLAFASTALPIECFQFDKYAADRPFRGPYVESRLTTRSEIHRFRTVIQAGSKGHPNFAGHLRVVSWGCGLSCQQFSVVDKKTGHAYLVPMMAEIGAKFQLNSRLFVVNPPEDVEGTIFNGPTSFVWDEISQSLRLLPSCDSNAQPIS